MKKGKLVIISGPSAGVGKDTLLRMFLDKHPQWHNLPSVITRPIRTSEVEGYDYFFVNDETFQAKAHTGEFWETDFHAGYWYGTPKQPIVELLSKGENVILRKDVNGSIEIKKKFPDAITIFIDAESHEVMEQRIRGRSIETSETEEQILTRLALAKKERELKTHFDHIVINPHGHPEKALAQIEKIVNL
jgi:guanylate kinase